MSSWTSSQCLKRKLKKVAPGAFDQQSEKKFILGQQNEDLLPCILVPDNFNLKYLESQSSCTTDDYCSKTKMLVFEIHSRQQHLQHFSHVERLLYRICVQGWGGGEDSSNSSQKRLFESSPPPSGCYSVTLRRKWSARFQNKGHSHSRVVL